MGLGFGLLGLLGLRFRVFWLLGLGFTGFRVRGLGFSMLGLVGFRALGRFGASGLRRGFCGVL